MNNTRKRVIVADDHPLILNGVRDLLSPHYDVIAVATDGRALVEQVEQLKPDIVVLDLHMPLLNGIEAAKQIKNLAPRTRMVFLSQQIDRAYVQAALRAGALGFVAKQAAPAELLDAIQMALRDHHFVTPLVTTSDPDKLALHNPRANPAELFGVKLTSRQREVLQLTAEGKTMRQIAEVLSISVKTVEFHKSMIMTELSMKTTAELTKYAIANGIIVG